MSTNKGWFWNVFEIVHELYNILCSAPQSFFFIFFSRCFISIYFIVLSTKEFKFKIKWNKKRIFNVCKGSFVIFVKVYSFEVDFSSFLKYDIAEMVEHNT